MNENIDLTKILKDCPKGTKLYSPIVGEVDFIKIRDEEDYPIITQKGAYNYKFTAEGFYYADEGEECLLFPSKDQRDWSKFTAPWYKKERFDPKTLKPFDKVLVRDDDPSAFWRCSFFSHTLGHGNSTTYRYAPMYDSYECCIPYNDDTKHLVGTSDEAPEFYRYWEE